MRASIALFLLATSCAPLERVAPCNDARTCAPDHACVLGTCRAPLPSASQVFEREPRAPEPLAAFEQLHPRATAGLVMLLAPDERSGHAALLHLEDAPAAASDSRLQCENPMTIEVMTRAPLSAARPLVAAGGYTLVGIAGARHHVLTFSDSARRYQNGALVERADVARAAVRDTIEVFTGDDVISLVAIYCRALSHREVLDHARFGDVLAERRTDDLVVRYRFAGDARFSDEGDGAALDLVPVGSTADVLGGVHLDGARLDGGFAPKIDTALSSSRAFTVELWVAPDDESSAVSLVSSRPGQGPENFELGTEEGRVMASARDTRFLDAPLAPGELAHLVLTHDGSAMTLYRDGTRVQTRTSEAPVFVAGRFGLGSELTGERPFFGTLYDAAVFSAALSEEEALTHYLAGPEATALSAVTEDN